MGGGGPLTRNTKPYITCAYRLQRTCEIMREDGKSSGRGAGPSQNSVFRAGIRVLVAKQDGRECVFFRSKYTITVRCFCPPLLSNVHTASDVFWNGMVLYFMMFRAHYVSSNATLFLFLIRRRSKTTKKQIAGTTARLNCVSRSQIHVYSIVCINDHRCNIFSLQD